MKYRSLLVAVLTTWAAPAFADGIAYTHGESRAYLDDFCATCSFTQLPLTGTPVQSAGGIGIAAAASDYYGTLQEWPAELKPGGSSSYSITAEFEGPSSLPALTTGIEADNAWAYSSDKPYAAIAGAYRYEATTTASTTRRYQYLGSQPMTYAFIFAFSGTLERYLAFEQASVAIYDGTSSITGLSSPISSDADSYWGSASGQPLDFNSSLTISVTVQPGDAFYLFTNLSGSTRIGPSTGPDIENVSLAGSLRVTSFSGDAALLLADPVPEPSSTALLALGLLMLTPMQKRWR